MTTTLAGVNEFGFVDVLQHLSKLDKRTIVVVVGVQSEKWSKRRVFNEKIHQIIDYTMVFGKLKKS